MSRPITSSQQPYSVDDNPIIIICDLCTRKLNLCTLGQAVLLGDHDLRTNLGVSTPEPAFFAGRLCCPSGEGH